MICPRCNKEIPDDAALCCYCGRVFVRKPVSHVHQRANGTGTAYKTGKGWMAEITVGWFTDENGMKFRRRLRKSGFKTRTDALAYAATMFEREHKKKAPQLSEYWRTYSSGEMEKLSDSKRTAYQIAWTKLQPIALRAIDSLSVADLRLVVSEKAQTYYPARDMKVVLSHLLISARQTDGAQKTFHPSLSCRKRTKPPASRSRRTSKKPSGELMNLAAPTRRSR